MIVNKTGITIRQLKDLPDKNESTGDDNEVWIGLPSDLSCIAKEVSILSKSDLIISI